ncbi:MAG TPA: RNA polymerase factor sigma-32 [Aliidongia sp.]|nr:RNA polymerase factor sigma-32 [Aliidongia sp.]
MMAMRLTASEGSSNSLSRYLQEIRKYPPLAPDQEFGLAKRWADERDPRAAERLVTSHLGLIVKIANGFRGYGLPLAELVAEGNVGMMQAIERFDPDRGFRLSTYAMWWIRAAILEYILRSWSMVRLCTTPRHKRLFFKLRKLKAQLQAIEDGDLSPEIVAKISTQLDVSEGDVITMNRRLAAPDQSLNAPLTADGDGEWQDWLVDQSPNQETTLADRQELDVRRGLLHRAMAQLNERELHILSARRLRDRPLKLDELATHYGVSRERIRQIEERAFLKIQEFLGLAPARPRRAAQPIFAPALAHPAAANDDYLPATPYPAAYAPQPRADWLKRSAMAG